MTYEVNEKTFAIIPVGQKNCKIIEEYRNYNVPKTSLKIIEHSCEYFGASYKSRLLNSYKMINTRYKSPILIEESSRMIFFPVTSPKNTNSYWINYSNVVEYYKSNIKNCVTVVRFVNGFRLEIPVSFYSFNNQFLKSSRLSAILNERMLRKI